MRKLLGFAIAGLFLVSAYAAQGAEFAFHGDMNHRFLLYTNHNDWYTPDTAGAISDSEVNESYGELKYRFWFEAGSDDGDVKGVYAMEVGGVRFGRDGSGKARGGSFSGDSVNVETRWAYLDFQLPFIEEEARIKMGLQPFTVNPFIWKETAAGVDFGGVAGPLDYEVAWMRGYEDLARDEDTDDIRDLDFFLGRLNLNTVDNLKTGVFALYGTGDADNDDPFPTVDSRDYAIKAFGDEAKVDMFTIGLDGVFNWENFFVNWDLMYQTGSIDDITFSDTDFSGDSSSGDFDLKGYLAHADAGVKLGKATLTYTFWYASGDDDASDNDFDAFLAIDLDREDSLVLFEGLYSDDATYFTERPYLLDKGLIMNKLALDYEVSDKWKLGGALLYMMTAEDIEYLDNDGQRQSEDKIGVEVDGYVTYMLFKNVEVSLNAGYLFSDDAMDAFEGRVDGDGNFTGNRDGDADENIWASSMRVRYRF